LRDTEGTNVQIDSVGIEEQRSSDYGEEFGFIIDYLSYPARSFKEDNGSQTRL